MNLSKLLTEYPILINRMKDDGYSKESIKKIEWEIKWIKKLPDKDSYHSYLDLYEKRLNSGRKENGSEGRMYHLRARYNTLQKFEEEDQFPNRHKRDPLIKKDSYSKLNSYYKGIIDGYLEWAKQHDYADSTIKKCKSKTSAFFLHFQNNGHKTLSSVSEAEILSYFTDDEGNLNKSRSLKKDIEMVLSAVSFSDGNEIKRIALLLPKIKKRRKNIQYFNEEESERIRSVLNKDEGLLSKRDKAIGVILFYTGMRAGDIADLRLDDIDWDNERIHKVQNKTGFDIELPLTPIIGNALYDYILDERPVSDDDHVFLWAKPPYVGIDSTVIWPVAKKIYEAAEIRMNKTDRKGSHLFRHHLATSLISHNVSRPVISEILGHQEPLSLDCYLYSDIENLRKYALDISVFPVAEGVFQL